MSSNLLFNRLSVLKDLQFAVEMSITRCESQGWPFINSQLLAVIETYHFYYRWLAILMEQNINHNGFYVEVVTLSNELKETLKAQPNGICESGNYYFRQLTNLQDYVIQNSMMPKRELDEDDRRISDLLMEGMNLKDRVKQVLDQENQMKSAYCELTADYLRRKENEKKKAIVLDSIQQIVMKTITTDPRMKETFEKKSVEELEKMVKEWHEKFNQEKHLQMFWQEQDDSEAKDKMIEELKQEKKKMEEEHQEAMEEMKAEKEKKEEEFIELNEGRIRLVNIEKEMKEKLEETEFSNRKLIEKNKKLKSMNDELVWNLKIQNEIESKLAKEHEKLKKRLDEMSLEMEKNGSVIEENKELKMELKEVRETWKVSGTLMTTMMEEKKRMEEKMERKSQKYHTQLNKLESEISVLKAKLEASSKTMKNLESSLEESKVRNDTLDGQLLEAKDLHEWAESEIEKLRGEKKRDEEKMKMMSMELDEEKKKKYEKEEKEEEEMRKIETQKNDFMKEMLISQLEKRKERLLRHNLSFEYN